MQGRASTSTPTSTTSTSRLWRRRVACVMPPKKPRRQRATSSASYAPISVICRWMTSLVQRLSSSVQGRRSSLWSLSRASVTTSSRMRRASSSPACSQGAIRGSAVHCPLPSRRWSSSPTPPSWISSVSAVSSAGSSLRSAPTHGGVTSRRPKPSTASRSAILSLMSWIRTHRHASTCPS